MLVASVTRVGDTFRAVSIWAIGEIRDRRMAAQAVTKGAATEVPKPTKNVSSKDGRIKVQKALNALGYPTGNEDGKMTKQTREAIKAFQLDISHDATGLLTAEQRQILFNDAASIASDDTNTEETSSGNSKQQARIDTE